jgi:hypothetical protein
MRITLTVNFVFNQMYMCNTTEFISNIALILQINYNSSQTQIRHIYFWDKSVGDRGTRTFVYACVPYKMQHKRVRAMTRVRGQDNIVHEWSGLYIHADCCFNDLTIQDPFWYLRPVKKKHASMSSFQNVICFLRWMPTWHYKQWFTSCDKIKIFCLKTHYDW